MIFGESRYGPLLKDGQTTFNGDIYFAHSIQQGLYLSELAAQQADSYRIRVGGVLVAQDEVNQRIGIFQSWNEKPFKFLLKHCVEARLFEAAREAKYTKALGLITSGPRNKAIIEGITSRFTPTLHMCDVCCQRADFYQQEGDLVVADTMPIITSTGTRGSIQAYSFAEMMAIHGHRSSADKPEERLYEAPDAATWAGAIALIEAVHEDPSLISDATLRHPAALVRMSLAWAA